MNFKQLIPDKIMMDTLGDDVIYQTITGLQAIKAIVSDYVDPLYAGSSHISAKRKTLDVAVADIPDYQKGVIFIINTLTYSVEDMIENDGYFAKLILIPC